MSSRPCLGVLALTLALAAAGLAQESADTAARAWSLVPQWPSGQVLAWQSRDVLSSEESHGGARQTVVIDYRESAARPAAPGEPALITIAVDAVAGETQIGETLQSFDSRAPGSAPAWARELLDRPPVEVALVDGVPVEPVPAQAFVRALEWVPAGEVVLGESWERLAEDTLLDGLLVVQRTTRFTLTGVERDAEGHEILTVAIAITATGTSASPSLVFESHAGSGSLRFDATSARLAAVNLELVTKLSILGETTTTRLERTLRPR